MTRVRTLIRIVRVVDTPDGLHVEAVAPGWNPHRTIHLPAEVLPDGMLDTIETSPGPNECDIRVFAIVDLAAARSVDLHPAGPWELHKSRSYPDDTEPGGLRVDSLDVTLWADDGQPVG